MKTEQLLMSENEMKLNMQVLLFLCLTTGDEGCKGLVGSMAALGKITH